MMTINPFSRETEGYIIAQRLIGSLHMIRLIPSDWYASVILLGEQHLMLSPGVDTIIRAFSERYK